MTGFTRSYIFRAHPPRSDGSPTLPSPGAQQLVPFNSPRRTMGCVRRIRCSTCVSSPDWQWRSPSPVHPWGKTPARPRRLLPVTTINQTDLPTRPLSAWTAANLKKPRPSAKVSARSSMRSPAANATKTPSRAQAARSRNFARAIVTPPADLWVPRPS